MVVKGRWELISHDRVVLSSECVQRVIIYWRKLEKFIGKKYFEVNHLQLRTPGLIAESVSILSFKDGCENLAV